MLADEHDGSEHPQARDEGPGWARNGLEIRAGRFPLSVEAHLLNMTAKLVPGATTVTINARYYALHGLVALEADQRGLGLAEAYDLLRRCEVVVAGASIAHPDDVAGTPHGYDAIKPSYDQDGFLNVAKLATPGGYSKPKTGFLNPYLGSELTLKILGDTALAPGSRLDEPALRLGFDGLFDLASEDQVLMDDLAGYPHLAIGAANNDHDGRWLKRVLCSVGVSDPVKIDDTRRGTVRLLCRAAQAENPTKLVDAFRDLVVFGDLSKDPVVASVPETQAWRGALFRHDSVGAWRLLWAWMVEQIQVVTPPSELQEMLAAALPTGTLSEFLDDLPATMDGAQPLDAEGQIRSLHLSVPNECLALLALGAKRSGELEGTARAALVGDQRRALVLSPVWFASWLDDRRKCSMADVAAELVTVLLDRSRRIAMGKLRPRSDGTVWLPTRVQEHAGLLVAVGHEGSGNVGLRLAQLAGILEVLGVLERTDGHWGATSEGVDLLDLPA